MKFNEDVSGFIIAAMILTITFIFFQVEKNKKLQTQIDELRIIIDQK